ncbi:MAG: ComF family protein [Deltaproteobacteria bacterium]|nr:ComF family protein [Deltaproteobacteria bacterium]
MKCTIRNSGAAVIEIVFPSRCVVCGDFLDDGISRPFCMNCLSGFHLIASPHCTRCGIPFSDLQGEDHLCGKCLSSEQFFSMARALGRYEDTLMTAIHTFKYGRNIPVGTALGRMMACGTYGGLSLEDFSLILPVPLHPKRLRERGFNQSGILAREIARKQSLSVDYESLERTIDTEPQTALRKTERSRNIRGAFNVRNRHTIKGKKILLIDDVFTTGSTVRECARVLLANGAEDVAVLTLARALYHKH